MQILTLKLKPWIDLILCDIFKCQKIISNYWARLSKISWFVSSEQWLSFSKKTCSSSAQAINLSRIKLASVNGAYDSDFCMESCSYWIYITLGNNNENAFCTGLLLRILTVLCMKPHHTLLASRREFSVKDVLPRRETKNWKNKKLISYCLLSNL